jgi:hypothetical protein
LQTQVRSAKQLQRVYPVFIFRQRELRVASAATENRPSGETEKIGTRRAGSVSDRNISAEPKEL